VNYNFSLKFGNNFSGDRSTGVEIMIYDGDPSVLANRIYNIQTTLLRCGGSFDASFLYNNQTPGSSHTFTATINLITGNGVDTNLTNNTYAFGSTIFPPLLTFFFPVVHK
jgi:hypothetical protein